MDQNGWLGILRQAQDFFGPIETQALQIVSQSLIGFLVERLHSRIGFP
jgi:hypothetical protein